MPPRVVGTPVARATLFFNPAMPRKRLHENDNPLIFIILILNMHNMKTAHPFRPSGGKGIAKRRATLKN